MRLIDADEVKRFLCKFISYDDDGEQYFGDVNSDTVYNGIDKIKTAYNKDKVVEQLADNITPNVDMDTGEACNNWVVDMQNEIWEHAIKIVENGGCESE